MTKKVAVIGAGFSGLSLAYYLQKEGLEVEIFEKSAEAGGMIQSQKDKYALHEVAANGFMMNDDLYEMLIEIKASYRMASQKAKKRFVFYNKPTRWPLTVIETLALAHNFLLRRLFNKKSLEPKPQQTLYDWGLKNLTQAATDKLLAPAMQGIYAGDIKELSSSLILADFFAPNKKRNVHKGLVSGETGMTDMIQALRVYLKSKNVAINYNSEFDFKNQNDYQAVVIATSVRSAELILQKINHSENADLLHQIKTLPVVSVTSYFKEIFPEKYKGFGVLVPRQFQMRVLGVLFNNLIFGRKVQPHAETWIFGGATDPGFVKLADDQIIAQIAKERKVLFGLDQKAIETYIHRWPEGLPYYNLDLEKILKKLKPMNKVYLHGNYLGKIGLSKILLQSQNLAKKIRSECG